MGHVSVTSVTERAKLNLLSTIRSWEGNVLKSDSVTSWRRSMLKILLNSFSMTSLYDTGILEDQRNNPKTSLKHLNHQGLLEG